MQAFRTLTNFDNFVKNHDNDAKYQEIYYKIC